MMMVILMSMPMEEVKQHSLELINWYFSMMKKSIRFKSSSCSRATYSYFSKNGTPEYKYSYSDLQIEFALERARRTLLQLAHKG